MKSSEISDYQNDQPMSSAKSESKTIILPEQSPGLVKRSSGLVIKRALDIVGSLFGLVVLSPLFLLITIFVKLESKGPAIFKQTRVGKGCRPFTFYKYRSMNENSDPNPHQKYISELIGGERAQDEVYKLTDDNRVTKVGRILRKTSLDELPQLFNVLKGDMSLVGPRPALPYEVKMYKDWYKDRLSVTPGMSGLWQVSGRSQKNFDEMVKLDLAYINKCSLWLDIKILLKTFLVVFSRQGAW